MANIKSAKKRILTNEKNRLANKTVKTSMKTLIKKADAAVKENSPDKESAVRAAIKKVDQAGAKHILHKNAVNRKKSQLAKKLG